MEHKAGHTRRNATLVVLAALFALAVGCGDGFQHRSGGALHSALANQIKDRMGGSNVELAVYTSCEGLESVDPATRCAGVRSANIEVFFDGKSAIFDFSNAAKRGRISDTGFEGYVLAVTEDSHLPAILDATMDPSESTIDAEDIDVVFDGERIAMDFRGLAYDDATFIKIDLLFE